MFSKIISWVKYKELKESNLKYSKLLLLQYVNAQAWLH